MEQNVTDLLAQKNAMILKGQIVEATEKFFADHVVTMDFDGTVTNDKSQMVDKMVGFAGAIANVNEITLHHAGASDNVSFAEFTFHFDMKDGSQVLWHEILRTVWEDGKVVNEQYFKG